MNDIDKPIAFVDLLQRCRRIEIPLIQRDYAQGRDGQKDVRDEFLKTLQSTLSLPAGDPKLPLNLDFIYGSMEGQDQRSFLPLDGQQRLTTLFLLHWYLAWRDGALSDFKSRVWDGKHACFTYGVRPSSTEFFDAIVSYLPAPKPENVSSVRGLLQDQPWFFLHWRLDPTIQSALTMFDAIHERFKSSTGLYGRLVNRGQPVITFQLLPLEHFGLTDDLYIKMNARGKPLTAFETFKARFEELLKELFPTETRKIAGADLSVAEFFTRRIDTQWTDFFWHYKNPETHTFDDALMKLIWAVVRVSLNSEDEAFANDSVALRNKELAATYTTFHDRRWLTREFAQNLICLLEEWSKNGGKFTRQLQDTHYFDETSFFYSAISDPAGIEYTGQVMFAGFIFYLRSHDGSVEPEQLKDWMRIVRNLTFNSNIERPDEYGRSLAGLKKLLPHSHRILESLAESETETSGFSPQQLREEVLKARLILSDPGWKPRILAAEQHRYFLGQIEFLLDFSGVSAHAEKTRVENWGEELHSELQVLLDQYFQKAQLMFNGEGVVSTGKTHLWKRALLTFGNYLQSSGRNESFLTNPSGNWDSWKRILRIGDEKRQHLKSLWTQLDLNTPVESQLQKIITGASGLEPWQSEIVRHPEVIAYCDQQEIRRDYNSEVIYLLKKRQMNGTHAELFSYALYLDLKTDAGRKSISPMVLQNYMAVATTEIEPQILLSFERKGGNISFAIESVRNGFRICAKRDSVASLPELDVVLRSQMKFVDGNQYLELTCWRADIQGILKQLAETLTSLRLATSSDPKPS